MKFLIVALMALLNGSPEGFEPPKAYVFTHTEFETWEECRNYVVMSNKAIMYKLWDEFGNDYRPHMISCVTEDVVKKIMKEGIKVENGVTL